ncbi:MAG: HlyD family efflux transporter periplasmic adaptor subunit [Nitrospira sp.]|nr:HlyD family efflux transporter periplasmic adaptor subunit [Nitrospira sp.]
MAPIDGVVQQLAVHTVGGVVTPAQQLLIIVPKDHPVEVEAQVENKDRGFVRQGQEVEIKSKPFNSRSTAPYRVMWSRSQMMRPYRKSRSGLSYQSQSGSRINAD